MKKPRILVVGSYVMDLIVSTRRFPQRGESVFGTDFTMAPGGKGANQACQMARLGAQVTMVGKVGEDDFGRILLRSAQDAGIDVSHVKTTPEVSSAVGNVLLEVGGGESINRIIIVPGANMAITPEDVAFLKDQVREYDMVVLQFEIPMQINELVAGYAHDAGVPVMLNAAPYLPIPPKLMSCLSYISPNEHEAKDITGITIDHLEDARRAVDVILDKGVKNALITLGGKGAVMGNREGFVHSPSVPGTVVVDPTAAGDSFVAAFCTAVCAGASNEVALRFANHTGSITVSRMGAQPSLPTLDEVLDWMAEKGAAGADDPALLALKGV